MSHGFREEGRYVESKAKTNRMRCSDCGEKINRGESVVFLLDEETGKMQDVYCCKCKEDYAEYALEDTDHPCDFD
jgi:hypothetical protein